MRRFIKSLIVIFILFQNCTCFNWKEENMVDKYSVLDSAVLQKCNQIYITDSNVFLMLYDFASPDAYDPFRIDPYLLCYDNNLEVQWCMFVDALKIISIKNDTILLLGRCNTEINTYSINAFFLNYLPIPSGSWNIFNKVIDSMEFDLITKNVVLKYREYEDQAIGLIDPFFFKDTTNIYSTKIDTIKHYDIIYNSKDEPDYSVKCIKTLDLKSNNMYHDIWILNDSNMLVDFYRVLNDYIIAK